MFQDARSYAGTKVNSDHKLVIGRMKIVGHQLIRKKTLKQPAKINVHKLSRDMEIREKYKSNLMNSLNKEEDTNKTPQERWNEIQAIIKKAGMESAGTTERTQHPNREPDREITEMSNKQKDLRLQIQNTTDEAKRQQLKRERNNLQHRISNRALTVRNQEIDKQVEEIEKNADDATLMYRAVKTLNRKKIENPKVQDENGLLATTPNEILEITTKFFQSKFQDEQTQDIEPFEGPPRRLQNEITVN